MLLHKKYARPLQSRKRDELSNFNHSGDGSPVYGRTVVGVIGILYDCKSLRMQRVPPRWGILRIFAAWPVFADKAIVDVGRGEE